MNIRTIKRLIASVCILGCTAGLFGCDKVIEYVDNYVPPTTPEFIDTLPEDTQPQPGETTPPVTEPVQQTLVGIVTGAKVLNVRSGPGTEYDKVGTYDEGMKVAIYERQQVGDSTWGRTKSGWISMNYIVLEDENATKEESTTTHSIIATVTTDDLNVRSGPGTRYDSVGRINTGDKVQITEICVLDNILWGKAKKGWLCMSYVTIDGAADGKLRLSGTVNASELMIRSSPGTDAKRVGSYPSGEKIVVTELRAIDYVPWGKTDKGWVCMNYVTPDGNIVVTAGS